METRNAMSSRKKKTSIVAVLALAFAFALGVGPALAVHNDGVFQIDGDAKKLTCGGAFGGTIGCTGDDWNSLYTCSSGGGLGCTKATPGVGNSASVISDLVVDLSPASIFTGGGSKDENDITQWNWKDGSVPDKDDLIEAFAALYNPTSGTLQGDKVIYFGANRLAVNGDAQIGFWFFQNTVKLKSDGTFQDNLGNPATHAVGDLLILSNFVQGGGTSNIQVYVVTLVNTGTTSVACPIGSVESSAGADSVCLQQIVNGTKTANGVCDPSTDAFGGDVACAATNGSVVSALDPDFTAKAGATTGNYPIVGFFEGGVNLTAVNLGGECFPSFAVETRSSQSITAVLKDFTLGKFEECKAGITTEIHSAADDSDADLQGKTVIHGTSIHDLAIVTGTAGIPLPTGNVTFDLFTGLDCGVTSGTLFSSETVGLTVGTTDSRADSTSLILDTGNYSYQATYNGDTRYKAITSTCEPLTVFILQSAIATHILKASNSSEVTDSLINLNGIATVGVKDQAVVTCNSGSACDNFTPSGTVTFQVFDNGACVGDSSTFPTCTASPTPPCKQTVTLTGGTCIIPPSTTPVNCGTALSDVINLDANTLSYRVTYSGDDAFLPSSASRCEPVCAIDTTK